MSKTGRLTPRRREILGLMAKGLTNREISQLLDISPKTVKSHVEAILRSLDVSNRTEAVGLYGELAGDDAPRSGLAQPFTSRPALAVLPFAKGKHDPDRDHIVDGLADELIRHLSRLRWIPVISRHSTFTYKHTREPTTPAHAFGRDLGAAYVVTGVFKDAGAGQVRVDVELVEAATDRIVWSDSVGGALQDSLLVEQLARAIVGSIDHILKRYIAEQVVEKDIVHLDAWETALRAFAHFYRNTPDENRRAETLFRASLEIRPSVLAYYGLADTYYQALLNQWTEDRRAAIKLIGEAALASLRLDPNADYSHVMQAVHSSLTGNAPAMQASFEAAISLNPSSVRSCSSVGKLLALRGEPEAGIVRLQEALRLGPREPNVWSQYLGMAMAHFVAERYEEALEWGQRGLALNPTATVLHAGMVTTYYHLGRVDEARAAADRLREIGPNSARSDFTALLAFASPEVLFKFASGLQALGVSP